MASISAMLVKMKRYKRKGSHFSMERQSKKKKSGK
jgi:hypothetical protein